MGCHRKSLYHRPCSAKEHRLATPDLCTGNPVHPQTGNKFQAESDYRGAGAHGLAFMRYYNSDAAAAPGSLGQHWRHGYERAIATALNGGVRSALITRPDGKTRHFYTSGEGEWQKEPDVTARLAEQVDGSGATTGWTYTGRDDTVETYDAAGRLVSITHRDGLSQTLAYDIPAIEGDDDPDTLDRVTGPFGRRLRFTYDAQGRMATLTDPAGGVYTYGYDTSNNLVSVTYPDNTPADDGDNPVRLYHYEDARFPHALTGISDENGERYATWAYDDQGRAISSEHAGGAERVTLTYNADGTTTVTDALGGVSTYGFETLYGVVKPAGISEPCAACGSHSASHSYDANGFPASRTDFNGNLTTYVYNARGLETSRTEAKDTPEERTITTDWHADFRQPERITAPGKETTLTYYPDGRLHVRTETDTTTQESRTWTYTYHPQGLLASVDGPRTDAADITIYEYDAQGNRPTTTNALGHVTRITEHDAHGRPLTLIDPNGLVTELRYDARGRLRTRDAGGVLTTFAYDGVGNLKRLTLPDGSYLDYDYDAAHRLAQITDSLGNRIEYTPDALGNREQEDVFDPNGVLTRTRTRLYNSLNRLFQDIGGAQQVTTYSYDAGGLLRHTDGPRTDLSDETTYDYDALDRLRQATDPRGGLTRYGYDGQDDLQRVTDARDNTTTYTYDGLGNLEAQTSPDTGTTTYDHDAAGNRTWGHGDRSHIPTLPC